MPLSSRSDDVSSALFKDVDVDVDVLAPTIHSEICPSIIPLPRRGHARIRANLLLGKSRLDICVALDLIRRAGPRPSS
jgi:hypothetical protein